MRTRSALWPPPPLCISHALVPAAVGVGTVTIVCIGVAYTKGGGGTSSICQLLGAADAQTAHPATFSTAPVAWDGGPGGGGRPSAILRNTPRRDQGRVRALFRDYEPHACGGRRATCIPCARVPFLGAELHGTQTERSEASYLSVPVGTPCGHTIGWGSGPRSQTHAGVARPTHSVVAGGQVRLETGHAGHFQTFRMGGRVFQMFAPHLPAQYRASQSSLLPEPLF